MRRRRVASFRSPVVVLDTNVTVPGLIGYGRVPPKEAVSTACIQAVRAGRVRLALSAGILEELLDVQQRAPFSFSYRTARRNVRLIERGARMVKVPGTLAVLEKDPDDNLILETAVVARADYLVTWNFEDYAELSPGAEEGLCYGGVHILAPGELLRTLRHEGW